MAIRIGILGYGNLAKGVELAVRQNPDMELVAVFSRRDPSTVKTLTPGIKVVSASEAADWQDKIDVLVICGGSATDLPKQTPEYAKLFNVIDSFDTHAKIPQHFANVDKAAADTYHTALISGGRDPVGDFGKGPKLVAESFQKTGIWDVTLKLYPEDRHELLNELDREQVDQDLLRWFEARL